MSRKTRWLTGLAVALAACIAVPTALAADYLRIVGLIARVFKDPEVEEQLRTVQTPAEFIEILARAETKL